PSRAKTDIQHGPRLLFNHLGIGHDVDRVNTGRRHLQIGQVVIDLLFRELVTAVMTRTAALHQHPAGDLESRIALFNVRAGALKISIQPSKVGRPHEDD
ncbi:hypothetical protein, partial [Stenotrophomonas lactitubi]|uniref:hypothetical protein n=1 Tax=Stenotrophomonas lactitubi TaxID=2045214 RepID=UPI001C6FC85B